jgi:hypothetical protein
LGICTTASSEVDCALIFSPPTIMILRSVAQVKLLFERLGFSLDSEWTSADGEGRDILWATLLFRLSEGHSRAIDRVER